MSDQGDDQDKSFDPTPHKLQEARRKGEVAKSVDLQTAASYAGLTLALVAVGTQSFISLGSHLVGILAQSNDIAATVFEGGPVAALSGWSWAVSRSLIPIFGLPALTVLTAILAQRAFVVTPSKLQPKLSLIHI